MYRPPRSEKHETIVETLDRLHNDIDNMMHGEPSMSFIKSKGIPSPEDIG